MTQQQLADAAGTDKGYISRLEAGGIVDPGVDVLERLANALKVPIRSLADPRLYEAVDEGPTWEDLLMADDRLSDDDKRALARTIRLHLDAADEEKKQAG